MNRRLKLTTSFLLGAFAVAFAWWLLRGAEPSYQGKSLGAWLDHYDKAGDMNRIEPACKAVRAMGTRALPYLVGYLKAEDSPLKLKLLKLAWDCHIYVLPPPWAQRRVSPALLALKALGQTASPVIPDLLQMFENPSTSRVGGLGLFSIGPASIPAFEQACANTNPLVRVEAAQYLSLLPASYNGDQEYYCVWHAVDIRSKPCAYVAKPPGHDMVVKLAWRTKNHSNADVRRACVEALSSSYGSSADDSRIVVRTLSKALKDPAISVRTAAKQSIEAHGIQDP